MTSNNQYEKCIRKKYTINNPNFFETDKIFNDFITHYNKKFDLYLVKCEFNLGFYNFFTQHIKTVYYFNMHIINLKSFF